MNGITLKYNNLLASNGGLLFLENENTKSKQSDLWQPGQNLGNHDIECSQDDLFRISTGLNNW